MLKRADFYDALPILQTIPHIQWRIEVFFWGGGGVACRTTASNSLVCKLKRNFKFFCKNLNSKKE